MTSSVRATSPFAIALCATLLHAWSARSEPSASDKALAESLFQQGRKALEAKDYDDACPKFAESYRLSGRLGTLLNLATCHQKQGKTASAWAEFTEAAAMAKAEKRREREKYARKQASALEKKLSRVVFEVNDPPPGVTLSLDGNEVGRAAWGTPVPVDPGEHELALSAPGKQKHTMSVTVKDGPSEQTVSLPALADEASRPGDPAAPAKPAKESTPRRHAEGAADAGGSNTLAWVALGVGVVGVGVGSYFGVQTFSKQSDSEDHCDGTSCDQTGVDLRDEAKGTATISTVAFGVGLAGVAVGTVLLLTAGGSKEQTALRISPNVTADGGGAQLMGRF